MSAQPGSLYLPAPRTPSDAALAAVRDVDPIALAVVLSQLAVCHPIAVAARTGIEVAALRVQRRRALIEASHDVRAAADWGKRALEPSADQLRRRRYPPNGDPQEWVRNGGAA